MSGRTFIASLLLTLFALTACRPAEPTVAEVGRSRLLMGTVVEITALGVDEDALETAITAAFEEMTRIEELMSPDRPESDVARLTAARGPMTVAAETAAVIAEGLAVAKASDGAFDMTLGQLRKLWGIESPAPQVPEPAAIRAALAGTGPRALQLDGRRVTKANPRLAVNLGGIAKGYAVDRALAVLREHGVAHAAVNAGGDMALLGDHRGRPWRIGIQHPRHADRILATLEVENRAVVTSGDYERYFKQDGVRYHHLFDPRTGRPARRCRAATVVASRAVLADALATAAFVLGPEAGLELLQAFPGVEGLLVAADGTTVTTPALGSRLTWP